MKKREKEEREKERERKKESFRDLLRRNGEKMNVEARQKDGKRSAG